MINLTLLTYQSSSVKDNVPITPNHFIHGQMGRQFAQEVASRQSCLQY